MVHIGPADIDGGSMVHIGPGPRISFAILIRNGPKPTSKYSPLKALLHSGVHHINGMAC